MESIDNLRKKLDRLDAKLSAKRTWLTPEAARELVKVVKEHLDAIDEEVADAIRRD